jgi:DNA-binding NarL/FixJ family response regulator
VDILKNEPRLGVFGQASSAEEALGGIPGLKPDLVLLNFTVPGMNGQDLIERLRSKWLTLWQKNCCWISVRGRMAESGLWSAGRLIGWVIVAQG